MAHLHIPDGVLPAWFWGTGLGLALVLLALGARTRRAPQRLAYEAALGALMLAAMALELPLGPVEYHLTLAGPVGILLGPAAAFQAAFIASAVLALMGHGGLTLIGLNALLLGLAAALAALVFRAIGPGRAAGPAMALATAAGHAVSGIVWLAVMLAATRMRAAEAGLEHGGRPLLVAGLGLPLLVIGVLAEAGAALGLGRFLARVRPDLIPSRPPEAAGQGAA